MNALVIKNRELQAENKSLKDELKKFHATKTAEALHLRCAELRLQRDRTQEEIKQVEQEAKEVIDNLQEANDMWKKHWQDQVDVNKQRVVEINDLQKQIDETPSPLTSWSKGWDEGYKTGTNSPGVDTPQWWKIQFETAQKEIEELKKDVELLQSQKQQYYGKGWSEGWGACEASGFHGQESLDTAKLEIQILRREAKELKSVIEVLKEDEPGYMKLVIARNNVINELKEENAELNKINTRVQNNLEELMTILRGTDESIC
jgi:hypothetical protein